MDELIFSDPSEYSQRQPIHLAIYGKNGVGKTTIAGKSEMKTVVIDCGDSGAITLKKAKNVKVIRATSVLHYLDIVADCVARSNDIEILVADTLTGLQSQALREVKVKRTFEMNQRKWGLVSARMIECITETRNFPNDAIYLLQEKRSGGDDEPDYIGIALTPSSAGFLSSCVDWVGRLTVEEGEDKEGVTTQFRYLDFRITEFMEAKDRAGLFPKRIKNPTYLGVRKKIFTHLNEGETT